VKDITELLVNNGREAVRASLRENQEIVNFETDIRAAAGPIPPKPQSNGVRQWKLPAMVDAFDFLATPLPKPPELVHGLLHKGDKMVLSGASKTNKTWTLTNLAMCVATGKSWWNLPTTQGRVLYANFEVGAPFFQRRIEMIQAKMGLNASQLRNTLKLWNLKGYGADITDLTEEITQRAKDQFDLTILDPIYKILGDRDENSNSEIGDLMNEIDRIIRDTGAAIIFGHHFSKGNQARKDSMDRMSGAGAFARDVETLVTLTKHEQENTYTVDSLTRNHKRMEPFSVVLDGVLMERSDTLNPKKLKTMNGSQVQYPLADLLKALGVQHLIRAELERQYRKATGAGEGTFDKLFKDAKNGGKIELCEDGKKWKAVSPVYPPGWNSCRDEKEENSATVQE
jgi:KaiC/GvpD/RAD55 family RecA-like ATPase